jgi:hypothetical protein
MSNNNGPANPQPNSKTVKKSLGMSEKCCPFFCPTNREPKMNASVQQKVPDINGPTLLCCRLREIECAALAINPEHIPAATNPAGELSIVNTP